MQAKREFFNKYTAKCVLDKVANKELKTSRTLTVITSKSKDGEWMSKEQMIREFGSNKTEMIIKHAQAHRPCSYSGQDEEWTREYKIIRDKTSEGEVDKKDIDLESNEKLKDEDRIKEVVAQFDSASNVMTIHDLMKSIKDEQGEKKDIHIDVAGEDLFAEHKNQATIDALTKDPRKVLRNIGEYIMNLKFAYQQCEQQSKYVDKLIVDVKSALTKMSGAYKKVESLVMVHRSDPASLDNTLVTAMAELIDKAVEQYNDVWAWCNKFFDLKDLSKDGKGRPKAA